jgi:hypothetical protein
MVYSDSFIEGYATYAGFSDYSYKCIEYLMDNNESVWKLLKHNESDAWSQSNLSQGEKATLIYNSEPDTTPFRVFMDSGNPDVWTKEICQLRIYPLKIFPQTRSQGTVLMAFEFFCHYKINQLSNYKTRIDFGIQELIGTFNGKNIAGIGRLHFNGAETVEDKVLSVGTVPFKGKVIYMSNKDI